MTRLKKLAIFIVAVLALGLVSLYWFNPTRREEAEKANQPKPSDTFSVYHPKADIKSFEFINDKNGLVVEWEYDKKEKEEAESTDSLEEWVSVNDHFLVRKRYKHRNLLASSNMKSDEYAFIDIFDLTQADSPKKELNLIQLIKSRIGDESFKLYGSATTLRKIGGNDYFVIEVGTYPGSRFFLLNLRTLEIDDEKTEAELNEQGLSFLTLSTDIDTSSRIDNDENYFTFDKTKDFKNTINLAKSNPKADALFTKENSSAYQVVNSENGVVTNGRELLDVAAEFLDEGRSIYDNAYLPAKYSTQGVKTKITSYDELLSYYNGERKSIFSY